MRSVLLILFSLVTSSGFAQSRREWLGYADEAFKSGDYASAAYFYQKVLDKKAAGSRDIVYPYDAKPWTKPEKVKDSTGASFGIPLIPAEFKTADTDSNNVLSEQEVKAIKEKKAQDTTLNIDLARLDEYYASQNKATVKPDTASKQPKNIVTTIRYTYVVHQVAESYRLSYDYNNAITWYEKSIQAKTNEFPDDLFWHAVLMMNRGKYDLATTELESYKKTIDSTSYMFTRAEKMLLSCAYATDPENVKQGFIVQELDSIINSGTSNFAANFFGDNFTLLFTSGRNGNKTPEDEEENARYYTDLYLTEDKGNGFSTPKALDAPLNSPFYEAAGTLSINGDLFFFTRWKGPGKKECAIYISKRLNNQWLTPQKMNANVNAEGFTSMQPSLSFDGTKLYFASDRPGGKGKMDIWVCPLDEAGNAGPAVNLGPRINTPESETAPFYHDKTTTLYYSSDGHVGFGGLDIYKAYASDEDTLWSTPINMGMPVNSNRDDSYFVLQRDQRVGYFSSDRKLCESCTGGSCYRIYKVEKEPLVFSISGKVFNSETNEPISNALLTFKDINSDLQPFYIITDETGAYTSMLREDMEFYIKSQKNHFFGDAATVSTKGLTESKSFEQDFFLMPIPAGDIVIPGIEYDYNSSTLRPQSKAILDSLVDFLNLNNNISIEISSHTDTRGSAEYNLNLSNERAKSVVDYLVSKGIAPERLIPQGYGETKPLISDEDIAKMKKPTDKEAAHQKNRRTAFRTTKEDAIRER